MSNPWDALDNSAIIMDYSKLLVGLAAHSVTLVGGRVGVHYIGNYFNNQDALEDVLDTWDDIINTLRPDQIAMLEMERPGVVQDMRNRLAALRQRLRLLSARLKRESVLGVAWPFTQAAAQLKQLTSSIEIAQDDFIATTRKIDTQPDPVVKSILSADAKATGVEASTTNIQLDDMQANEGAALSPDNSSTSAPAPECSQSIPEAPSAPPEPVPADANNLYYKVTATTAALIPTYLRFGRRARPRASASPV
ncbi:hypothetical protein GY45DRAFT_1317924 [Cubamyces sp. BRFM 1775]|nr:hypothetical protein GY45DRAFT_1317924 [Cubamyces sp. BRFM 1775]